MASDRDTLAELIDQHPTIPSRYAPQIADRVIAAGWRPPARVVADGGEVEAIAVEWMRYIGYTAEQIAEAEGQSCADTCERVGDAWDCTDQDGDSLHPVADELAAAVAMANVAMETIEARGWRPPAREITDPDELDKLPGRSIVVGHRGRHGTAYQLTSYDGFAQTPMWGSPYDFEGRSTSRGVIEREGRVTVLHVPAEEESRG